MKKLAATFIVLFVLAFSVFADGDIPLGGKSCPNGQISCFVATETPDTKPENLIFKRITDFWKSLFG
jgi:hypothetical protein